MGIFISVNFSNSLTQEEWEPVYEETLDLVKAFQLAERREMKIDGMGVYCLVPTEERKHGSNFFDKDERIGCMIDGDYQTMKTAEAQFLPRNLVNTRNVDPAAGDAMLYTLPYYIDIKGSQFEKGFRIFHGKTQGEPYHIYLLAIACTIEARLGKKAFVSGDITRGQCKRAVEMANAVLKTPIKIPDRCDMERLYTRISELPLNECEKLRAFIAMYLGTKDTSFWDFVQKMYAKEVRMDFSKDQFANSDIGTLGFTEYLKNYLLLGLDLVDLCSIVNFYNKEGEPQFEKFVTKIMDTKLHIKDKDCSDPVTIDQEHGAPYGVNTLLGQFCFAGYKNNKVDRYIPLEKIREDLVTGIGDKCDVNIIIDKYIEKEAEDSKFDFDTLTNPSEDFAMEDLQKAVEVDASRTFKIALEKAEKAKQTISEDCDIEDTDDFLFYAADDTVSVSMQELLKKFSDFYMNVPNEDHFKNMVTESPREQFRFLVERNRYLALRYDTWKKIYEDIQKDPQTYKRYYPMVCLNTDSESVNHFVTAFVTNDEFYNYCKELVKEA